MLVQTQVLKHLILKGPGRTQVELATAIHGRNGYQQRVNQDCALLIHGGEVERRGSGRPGDPYRYYPRHARTNASTK